LYAAFQKEEINVEKMNLINIYVAFRSPKLIIDNWVAIFTLRIAVAMILIWPL